MTEAELSGRREHLENSLAHVDEQIADTVSRLRQLGVARATILQMMQTELQIVPEQLTPLDNTQQQAVEPQVLPDL